LKGRKKSKAQRSQKNTRRGPQKNTLPKIDKCSRT
jgi:hypothetical protein